MQLPANHLVKMVENVFNLTPATAPVHGVALAASNVSVLYISSIISNRLILHVQWLEAFMHAYYAYRFIIAFYMYIK